MMKSILVIFALYHSSFRNVCEANAIFANNIMALGARYFFGTYGNICNCFSLKHFNKCCLIPSCNNETLHESTPQASAVALAMQKGHNHFLLSVAVVRCL